MRAKYFVCLTICLLVSLFLASSCFGGFQGDWAALPEYLNGGVVIYGDSRTGHDAHQWIMKGIATLAPAAVFHTGDLVQDGRKAEQWITFNKIASQLPSGTPIYPAIGNHEYESSLYFDNFDLPGNERWYTIDQVAGFNFIVLDSGSSIAAATTSAPASSQYQWLERELSASVSDPVYTIVTFHYPLYSTGLHGNTKKSFRKDLIPLFEKYGVDAVFSGHDHDYERSTVNGIRYIVTGGGGGPLRDQKGKSAHSELYAKAYHFCVLYFDAKGKLMAEAWSADVKMIDRFEIVNR